MAFYVHSQGCNWLYITTYAHSQGCIFVHYIYATCLEMYTFWEYCIGAQMLELNLYNWYKYIFFLLAHKCWSFTCEVLMLPIVDLYNFQWCIREIRPIENSAMNYNCKR